MSLVVLLGGARCGKSHLAQRLAHASGTAVTVIATAEARDEEMARRIAQHRRERPAAWSTIEEPIELERSILAVPEEETAIVDCLTLWVANRLEAGTSPLELERAAKAAAEVAALREGRTIVVSNEVGLGIVPADAGTRAYRDSLGRVNAIFAEAAELALFVAAGRVLELRPPDELLGAMR
jgi:adenosyl cobinamide kinase/adenosyl cobinamide phosphate guanylyltransferase